MIYIIYIPGFRSDEISEEQTENLSSPLVSNLNV